MKTLPTELEAKIDEINLWLFDGDRDRIAARANKSRRWVSKVLNKHAFNAKILEVAIEVMDHNKARFQCSRMKIA